MKKLFIHIRTWIKLISLVAIAAILVVGGVAFIYKPTYSVSLGGEFIGYTKDKTMLQSQINNYIENGDGENIAFVQVDNLPEYQLCLLKKDIQTNDDVIFAEVKDSGTAYYRYYAILDAQEEKYYVATFEEAEKAVDGLKDKNSKNKEDISIVEKYEVEPKDIISSEEVISKLYEKVETKKAAKTLRSSGGVFIASSGVNNSANKVNLGIGLVRPVAGSVTSRFGQRWGRGHKGIDIGAPKGTPIKAAAAGTVILSSYGYNGGYGNYIILQNANGVQTVYGHCTSLNVKVGAQVSQGQTIGTVGSTGRSTGNHLHFEIRVNGVAQNPQNYLY